MAEEKQSPDMQPQTTKSPTPADPAMARLLAAAEAKKREIQAARAAEESPGSAPAPESLKSVFKPFREEPVWVACGSCGEGYSKLHEDGLCPPCHERKDEQGKRQQALQERVLSLFGPGALERCKPENYLESRGTEIAAKILGTFDPYFQNLFLYGWPGSGKTYLAEIICVRMIRMGLGVEFKQSRQFVGEIPPTSELEARPVYEHYAYSKVMVLDEIGLCDASEWSTETICRLINMRQKVNPYGLILTSNLGLKDLARKFGNDRLTSRINGMCQIVPVFPRDESGEPIDWRHKLKNVS